MVKTYGEWQQLGYQVIKGQKAMVPRPGGRSLFSRNQVKPLKAEYNDPGDEEYYTDLTEVYENAEYFNDIGDR